MNHLLSVTIITLNEEKNIARCLNSLSEITNDIILVDSGSTDRTLEIASQYENITILKNQWLGYGQQKNFAHSMAKKNWVLNIDADEALTLDLKNEITATLSQIEKFNEVYGFSIPRLTHYLGRDIRHGGWYPNRLVRLSRKDKSKWTEPALHEELIIDGKIMKLSSHLMHYSFHSIEDQVLTNIKYAKLGSKVLRVKNIKFSLLKVILKPIGKFIETYFLKLGLVDGIPGLIISINASYSIFLKYVHLYEFKDSKIEELK